MAAAVAGSRMRARQTGAFLIVVGLVAVMFSAFSPSAMSATSDMTFVSGNPTCADFGTTTVLEIPGVPSDGNYAGAGATTITIANATDTSFDWAITSGTVSKVIVKAGNGANVYSYGTGGTGDTGLQSPDNGGEQQATISHVLFCTGAPSTTTTTEATTTTTGRVTTTTGNTFCCVGEIVTTTLAPTTTEAPTTTAPAVVEGVQIEQTTTTAAAAPEATSAVLGVQLARTGSDTNDLLFVAGLALLLGGAAILASDKLATRTTK